MLIKDSQGKYELRVDTERKIVYEKHMGLWNENDINRFHNDYLTTIFPLINGREWFKCTDLSEYILSNITPGINKHVNWCVKNGLFGAIMIVKNNAIEAQINTSVVYSKMIFSPIAFTSDIEAHKWLDSHWI